MKCSRHSLGSLVVSTGKFFSTFLIRGKERLHISSAYACDTLSVVCDYVLAEGLRLRTVPTFSAWP